MAYYQLYHYSDGRRFDHADRFDATDDSAALAKTMTKAGGFDMELWCGHRRVRVFDMVEGDATG